MPEKHVGKCSVLMHCGTGWLTGRLSEERGERTGAAGLRCSDGMAQRRSNAKRNKGTIDEEVFHKITVDSGQEG